MRPPPGLTLLLVALVSGMVRASAAAASTFSGAYSRLLLDGVRISTTMVPASDAGRKLEPPNFNSAAPMAPTRLSTAKAAIQLAVVQRPGDDAAVAVGLVVEPLVEARQQLG